MKQIEKVYEGYQPVNSPITASMQTKTKPKKYRLTKRSLKSTADEFRI